MEDNIKPIDSIEVQQKQLLSDLRQVINKARNKVASTVNFELSMMYWHIGERINRDVLQGKRAEYGKQIVENVAKQLQMEFGAKGLDAKNIRRMMIFAAKFPQEEIVASLMRKLSWTHILQILPLKDTLAAEFYLTLASSERWSVRRLRHEIDAMLYERTAISRKPEQMIKQELSSFREDNIMTPDMVFKSPYFLEFTGLTGMYSERDLEDSLLAHLEKFILELGNGFSFIERQKRMIIDGQDFYLDLLFYHRRLHRLVAIELKLGSFKAHYKGQMELYLRYLEKYEMEQGEQTPLGLLLCTEGNDEQIELLQLDKAGIQVAQYLTELPSKALLKEQITKSIAEYRHNKENQVAEKD